MEQRHACFFSGCVICSCGGACHACGCTGSQLQAVPLPCGSLWTPPPPPRTQAPLQPPNIQCRGGGGLGRVQIAWEKRRSSDFSAEIYPTKYFGAPFRTPCALGPRKAQMKADTVLQTEALAHVISSTKRRRQPHHPLQPWALRVSRPSSSCLFDMHCSSVPPRPLRVVYKKM